MPVALRLGHPRAALIVAPHPDDETIAAFGLIGALLRRGTRVSILVVTDGAASHPGSVRWPPSRLARERRGETSRAMRLLGVTRGAVRFLDLPDGRLEALPAVRLRSIARVARGVARLDLLVGPALSDGHEDHRCIADVLQRVRLPGTRRLTYQVWPIERRRSRFALPLDQVSQAGRRAAIGRYRTQFGDIVDRRPGDFALSPRERAALSRPVEHFEPAR